MNNVPGLETKSSGLATLLSFLCPGLGHLYLGKVLRGALMMTLTLLLYFPVYAEYDGLSRWGYEETEVMAFLGFFVVAFAWWVWGMVSANRLCRKHNALALLLYHRMFSSQNG